MISCGLDQALRTSGFSIFDGDKLIKYGTFSTKNTAPIEERLGQFGKELSNLHNEYNFEHLFFEDCQKQQNLQTYSKLSMIKAAVLLGCYGNEVPYTILSPSHGRSVIKDKYKVSFGRKREEQKKAAQDFIKEYCGASVTTDEADALCIAIAGMLEYNKNKSAF